MRRRVPEVIVRLERKHTAFVASLFDTGLGAIRSLGRVDIPVIGLDSDPRMPGFKSRFCTAKLCPDPAHQPDKLAAFLLNEGQQLERPGILFAASDAFCCSCPAIGMTWLPISASRFRQPTCWRPSSTNAGSTSWLRW